jgi:hypothetical protein
MRRNLMGACGRHDGEATGGGKAALRQALVHEGFDGHHIVLGDESDG